MKKKIEAHELGMVSKSSEIDSFKNYRFIFSGRPIQNLSQHVFHATKAQRKSFPSRPSISSAITVSLTFIYAVEAAIFWIQFHFGEQCEVTSSWVRRVERVWDVVNHLTTH